MLRQSNLAPLSAAQFDPSWHTCKGDIFITPPGLQILVQWTKTHQMMGQTPVLPITEVPVCPADPIAAYRLLAASPTTSADQSLLSYLHQGSHTTVTVLILSQALATLLQDVSYDAGPFPLHSLHRGGGGATQFTGRACTRSTSNVRDCGPATSSGSTSSHHVLPPSPFQRALLALSTTLPSACPPLPPTPPPPPNPSSSSTHHHHKVATCHSSSPHH